MREFDFSYDRLVSQAMDSHALGERLLAPGGLLADPLTALEEPGLLADDHDRRQAQQENDIEEVADEPGGVEHRLARLPGIADGEETHQDVRQPGGAEHQPQAQR